MALKRCFYYLLRILSSGWSSDTSFRTPGAYVELQLAMPYRFSRELVYLSWVMVTVLFSLSRVTPIPSTKDTSLMSVLEKRLMSFCLVRLSSRTPFPSKRTSSTYRVRIKMSPHSE